LKTFSSYKRPFKTDYSSFFNKLEMISRNDRAMEYLSRKGKEKREKRNSRWESIFWGCLTLGAILFMIACFMIAIARGAIVWAI